MQNKDGLSRGKDISLYYLFGEKWGCLDLLGYNQSFIRSQLMGKKGKYKQVEEEPMPKKNTMITEEQLMDKSHMDKTEYLPLLPDEAIYPPFIYQAINEAALEKIVTDLNYLLYVNFKQFWSTVLYNPTLRHCLSSCITFLHRRWLNNYIYSKDDPEKFQSDQSNLCYFKTVKDEPVYELTEGLTQVILLVYHRIVSFNQQNKELSLLYRIGEDINKKYILDIPRLLQICEIYGDKNTAIVRYIVKMYVSITPDFYATLTQAILPVLLKRIEDDLRMTKVQTDREEYGINYSYKRLVGHSLSQGEEELRKKTIFLMDYISFSKIVNIIIMFFPENCLDHCYFNIQIPQLFENIFLELQIAYKSWDYQEQETKILGMINYILQECISYMVSFFKRCEALLVSRSKTTSTIDAYVLSLQRIFKDFGRRMTVSRKNSSRSLLMFKIIQKQFDLQGMLHSIYEYQSMGDDIFQFNMEYLKDIIIAFDTEFKNEHIDEEEPRQEEIEQETQAEIMDEDDIDDLEEDEEEEKHEKVEELKVKASKEELDELQQLVPKRMRSEDYYTKLYADFNNKYYKGEYDDDYDEITDYDKRPLVTYQESSSSESDADQSHLITNPQYLDHIKQIHNQRFTVNREDVRKKNTNQPTFGRVQNREGQGNTKKYVQRGDKPQEQTKKKYVEKGSQPISEEGRVQSEDSAANQGQERAQNREKEEQVPENRGGQGFKKSNKSYNHKPKDRHDNNERGRNANKTKEFKEKKYK